ncbi:hypothetical protein [Aliirhizobium cellulosilyticum]|uniref:Uncharacterized protein n=1 Tax=Aliirhizobium cellulosilyticum TaxID=393664 RepID=A0A7W6Y4L9_9HYPH|nr:hypothetical protein [Rhizobium cellulosilyticum]MBB4349401.1 hypothetical protein [Rhizobium cellulosilyticum]MBB4412377.1 hypothetical protein [Rhizobium cellulosilyticum]MBB4447009.1 hypothetical protein [Rhizobium cellulosilyticum]
MKKQMSHVLIAVISTALWSSAAFAQSPPVNAPQKNIGEVSRPSSVATLLVMNADSATLEGGQLVLSNVAKNTIAFAERPVKAAGHLVTQDVISQWGEGPDNFAENPPNATISVLSGGSKAIDAVVTLRNPKMEGSKLTFDVSLLEGKLDGATGPAALFIDHWRGWRNVGWYGLGAATGALAGAAAFAPRPPVVNEGYYEYPPVVEPVCPYGYYRSVYGECRYSLY